MRVDPTHHALGHLLGVDAGVCRQRALHQQLADTDAEAAADQLDEQEAAVGVELVPGLAQAARLLLGRQAAQRQQALFDPVRQTGVAGPRRRGQDMGDGLGEVAHRLVTGLEQPVVHPRGLAGGAAHQGRRHHLARLAAGQEVHRPGRVGRWRIGEVAHQRRDLVAGGGAGVEFLVQRGEAAHAAHDALHAKGRSIANRSTFGTRLVLPFGR